MSVTISTLGTSAQSLTASPLTQRQSATDTAAATNTNTNTSTSVATDKVSLNSSDSDNVVYSDPRLNKPAQADLQALLEESDRKAQAIIDLIRPLVEQQGLQFDKVASGEQKVSASPEAISAAKAAIADGGEFSVQKTAERILSFAKASIGDDPSKLEKVRAAVEQGFKEASDILGGSLPDISKQTLAAIRTEFDSWAANGIPSGDTVTLSKPVTVTAAKAA
ncbi:DUF5610 domain-containing protein [Undibacterium sp. TJN19]|uniref:DUF5610 domain-containing protein n=1 Tax=Undibacterium sp. TJN19 TaxID=3413055 RepID=UPI003BF291EF